MFGSFFSAKTYLSGLEFIISEKHPVPNISVADFRKALGEETGSAYLIFDIREKDEYDLSHIHSAIHVLPDTTNDDFLKAFSDRLRGKHLVFYCSVGERSSEFLEKVQEGCNAFGAASLSNLTGGIFRWYNDGYPVENDRGVCEDVHPYTPFWGMFIERRRKL